MAPGPTILIKRNPRSVPRLVSVGDVVGKSVVGAYVVELGGDLVVEGGSGLASVKTNASAAVPIKP
jgi:hypothetical protein